MGSIGAGLRKQRENAGYTVRQVVAQLAARGIELSEKTIYSWETDRRQPDGEMLMTLCDIYGTADILDAFGYGGKKPDAEEPVRQLSEEMDLLVHTVNRLSPADREYITELAKRLAERG